MAADLKYEMKDASSPEEVKIISLSGEVDESNQEKLEELLKEVLSDDKISNVVFNIQNLDYINSGVIGLFAVWHEKFVAKKKSFVFSQANDHIYDILDLVGLTSVVDSFSTDEEACLSFEN